jgi:hypothetical protein
MEVTVEDSKDKVKVKQPLSAASFPSSDDNNHLSSKDNEKLPDEIPALKTVSWFRQFYCLIIKNVKLLIRRPLMLFVMIFSSVFSVLLAWAAGRESDDAIYPEYGACGAIDYVWLESIESYKDRDNVVIGYNENWRLGTPVAVMALGPMANAICILLILQSEIGTQLLGVLRALGLRDSVYWISWYLPFILVSFVNALLGAITAQTLPTHAFESIYFGGVFASLFFLQLALASASFFVAALCGTAKRAGNWLILLMLISLWIPTLIVSGQSNAPYSEDVGGNLSPVGLLWQNAHTYSYSLLNYSDPGAGTTECSYPIVSEFQGNFYKTDAQRELVRDDEYHVGCHFLASWTSEMWNPSNGGEKFGLGVLYLFPYLHFNGMWGNFLGYTSMPDRKFTSDESDLSPEALAIKALPTPPDPARGLDSSLFPQATTIKKKIEYQPCYSYPCPQTGTCPLANRTGAEFCTYLNDCNYAEEPIQNEAPSVGDYCGHLLLLSILYLLLAGYWAQIFPGGNGKRQKFYFPFQPSYWLGSSQSQPEDDGSAQEASGATSSRRASVSHGGGVVVDSVRKLFGSVEAIKGVSFKMERGEVTALLGQCMRCCFQC